MTERKAFESWFDEYDPKLEHDEPNTEDEAEIYKYWMFTAWQVSRKVACDQVVAHFESYTNETSGRILAEQVKEMLK